MTTIGTRVRELRQAKGLSQQALAGEGISPGYVSLIESGKRTPSAAAVERLAERLGVSVRELADEPTPVVSDMARLEVNFARLALGNGNPTEAIRTLGSVNLDELDSGTACDAALVLAESLQQTGHLDRAVAVLEALVERCVREESWLTFAQASCALAIMYIESGDTGRSVDTAKSAVAAVEAAGLTGTEEHIQLSSVLISALVERGDLGYATLRAEELIEVADNAGSARARGSVYWNAAAVAYERGRVSEALRLTDRATALLGDEEVQPRPAPAARELRVDRARAPRAAAHRSARAARPRRGRPHPGGLDAGPGRGQDPARPRPPPARQHRRRGRERRQRTAAARSVRRTSSGSRRCCCSATSARHSSTSTWPRRPTARPRTSSPA